MINDRMQTIAEMEEKLKDREDEANSLMMRNQLVIEMMQDG